jgi:DNA-binding HxlR family transcriptional regulator
MNPTKRSNEVRGEIKEKILAELSSGPKHPRVLRDAIGDFSKMSFARALRDLQDSGQIKRVGLRPPSKTVRYRLVSDA